MKSDSAEKNVKLVHQVISISQMNFATKSLIGQTELTLKVQKVRKSFHG